MVSAILTPKPAPRSGVETVVGPGRYLRFGCRVRPAGLARRSTLPFPTDRQRWDRVRCELVRSEAARPGRRGPLRACPEAPGTSTRALPSPSSTRARRWALMGLSCRKDLLVVVFAM